MNSDLLAVSRRRRSLTRIWRRFAGLIAFVTVIGLMAAAVSAKEYVRTEQRSGTESADHLIALVGDASAGKDGCPGGCRTYTEQLAASVQQGTPEPVTIEDRSWRSNTWPPATVNSVAAYLRADPGMRRAVRSADVLVLALTGSSPVDFTEQLRRLLDEIDWIRQDRPIDLRVVVAPTPSRSGTWAGKVAETGCQVVVSYAGACVNVSELIRLDHLSPGDWQPTGRHPRLSQHGHDVIARELLTGGGSSTATAPNR